jgi:Xaa-Pro aminopeptidase
MLKPNTKMTIQTGNKNKDMRSRTDFPAQDKIAKLRSILKEQDIAGFVVPRSDAFQGEYVPPSSERLKWLTGFSGSWGTAIVATRQVALVVDGRYTIQAEKQTRHFSPRLLSPDNDELKNFLASSFKPGAVLGYDPWLTSISEARRLNRLATAAGLKLSACVTNPVDRAWDDRPKAPNNPIYLHPLSLSGMAKSDKLDLIAKSILRENATVALLTDPHAVAWALNIRGSDISHTPIALLRALIFASGKATLFVEKERCPQDVMRAFKGRVALQDPQELADVIRNLGKKSHAVMVDSQFCPEALRISMVKAKARVIEANDPCSLPRARKNPTEQNGSRTAHIRDGAALANFLCWFDKFGSLGGETEVSVANKLLAYRQATGKLEDLSFDTISAAGPNAALPHYHAEGKSGRKLKQNEIYLIDSGGQYRDGTTDVTRTLIVGTTSKDMQRHFTLVLKGMIAVSTARFPKGTTGVQLDALARAALWQQGFDFDHGTGHGVGSYLSVHEGPARISKAGQVALEPGMILSNEPGYYRKGHYGIRIENLLLVKPEQKVKGGDRPMLSFETLTFAPIDRRLFDESLLTKFEVNWLDTYHAEVHRKIGQLVNNETKSWLQAACAPLK